MRIFSLFSGSILTISFCLGAVQAQSLNGSTDRYGPSSVNRKIAESRLPVPRGYKAAWTDGRLNPLTATGTSVGKAQMLLIWSDTVPRRLIDPATGKPVK